MTKVDEFLSSIEFNEIKVERAHLDFEDTVAACLLRFRGVKHHTIAAMLGTNPARVAEALTGYHYPNAPKKALELIAADKPSKKAG